MSTQEQELRDKILSLVREYYGVRFGNKEGAGDIQNVRYAGRVFDEQEMVALVDSSLDFWLTAGRYTEEFEASFADFVGTDYAMFVNSGSSANLLAFRALTSPLLGEKRLRAGDEVITVAAGFPTTVNPIITANMVPVFVDVDLETYNISIAQVKAAITPKTRAIFVAHTLGNPFNLDAVMELVKTHNLFLVEDCCDALGSTYKGKHVGTFGHIATCSFYPAHHITTGEGGMVFTNNTILARAAASFRDWGRDCYCKGGENNTCGKRFTGQYGTLPYGYDHKSVYSHIGYNLKVTDMQAAIGVEQLKKLPQFVEKRKENFRLWLNGFAQWKQYFILPHATQNSDPSWFAFPVSVKDSAGFTRTELTAYLAEHQIETRTLFAGNMVRQPAYQDINKRVHGVLENADFIMEHTFFLGTYPGLTERKIAYSLDVIQQFLSEKAK